MSEMLTCDTSVILGKFAKLGVNQMVRVHKAAFANENKVLVKEARLQLSGVTARSKRLEEREHARARHPQQGIGQW